MEMFHDFLLQVQANRRSINNLFQDVPSGFLYKSNKTLQSISRNIKKKMSSNAEIAHQPSKEICIKCESELPFATLIQ